MTTLLDTIPAPRALPPGREADILADLLASVSAPPAPLHEPQDDPGGAGRTGGRRWRYLLTAGGVAAATAVVLTVGNITGAGPAYASWTANPSAASSERVDALASGCVARVRDAHAAARPDLAPVAAEQRGAYTTMLVAAGDQVSVCADWTGSGTEDGYRGGVFEGLVTGAALPAGQTVELLGVPGQMGGSDAVRIAFGLTSPQVRRVVVRTTGGLEVTATVAQRHFIAWWPSGDDVASLRAFDGAGRDITDTDQ